MGPAEVQLVQLVTSLVDEVKALHRKNDALERRLSSVEAQLKAHTPESGSVVAPTTTTAASPAHNHQRHHYHHQQQQRWYHDSTLQLDARAAWLGSAGAGSMPPPPAPQGARVPWSCFAPWSSPSSSLPSVSSFSGELSVLQLSMPSRQALEEMCMHVSFLRQYDMSSKDFAVQDLQTPVCVFTERDHVTAPLVSFVNESFLRLTGYTQDEVIGTTLPTLFSCWRTVTPSISLLLLHQKPMSVSEVYRLRPLLRKKNGSTIRVEERTQFFYDQTGQAAYTLICLESWQPDILGVGEWFEWTPIQ
jgi:PAS domain S-box-containing protein